MANLLRERGWEARIVLPRGRESLRKRVAQWLSLGRWRGRTTGFLHEFKGPTATFRTLNDLSYQPNEIVIAVGTYSVPDVRALTKPVVKLRFNHGFPAKPDALQEQAWRGSMPTITVSNTLVPRLRELSGEDVLAVVPNGIDTRVYFPDTSIESRPAIGAVLNSHPNKAPEDMLAVLAEAHQRHPDRPQVIFSTERRPEALAHTDYHRLPSADQARRLYNRAKVWLLTSRTEGLPGVVLEAMACGCVVISTDNDGSLEILRHEENGLIVPRGDRAAFLAQIDRVFSSPDLAARLSNAALTTTQQFTWARAADKMETVLQSLHRTAPTSHCVSVASPPRQTP